MLFWVADAAAPVVFNSKKAFVIALGGSDMGDGKPVIVRLPTPIWPATPAELIRNAPLMAVAETVGPFGPMASVVDAAVAETWMTVVAVVLVPRVTEVWENANWPARVAEPPDVLSARERLPLAGEAERTAVR